MVPYTKGLCKCFKNVCCKLGAQVYFNGGNTIRNLLAAPPGQRYDLPKSRVIYRFIFAHANHGKMHIGELARPFWERFKEHLRTPPPSIIMVASGHHISVEYLSIVGTEAHSSTRTIKKAMYIRVNNLSLNRNIGKFQLPHIWDEVLQETFALHPK